MVPSYSRKAISGWINYPCTVISHMMSENEMGYRGSKSTILYKYVGVKEQRVDGSWCINPNLIIMHLRCTLMGFERNYQIKIPSKQLNTNTKKFSTLHSPPKLNPWFVTGIADSEGTFTIMIDQNIKRTIDWRVQAKFQIGINVRDLELLLQIQQYFNGIGSIGKSGNMIFYSISSVKDLTNIIIPHFEKYSLLTQKAADFMLFKKIVKLMNNKAHLFIEGLHQIINIKASMNIGVSNIVKSKFNNIIPIDRPIINTENIPDPHWITGFVNGEGTFDVKIYRSKNKIGHAVQLRFRIPQHERDTKLIELLIKYFGSGVKEEHTKFPAVTLVIVKFSQITEKIIPFFELYPLIGHKKIDFFDWCKIARLMSDRSHLTYYGLNLIRQIKAGMNKGRK
uniref:LAGLIDADG endonuclease n=1 Tax=Clavaria fumosa TaxID=264083 RepID=A0A7T3PCS8_9AGAR|nr:LAGLIDADG endonuclease [Clavaria fumosa]QPZ51110.1 LAGLIDADG endonuclease [Clavaria fumosa]